MAAATRGRARTRTEGNRTLSPKTRLLSVRAVRAVYFYRSCMSGITATTSAPCVRTGQLAHSRLEQLHNSDQSGTFNLCKCACIPGCHYLSLLLWRGVRPLAVVHAGNARSPEDMPPPVPRVDHPVLRRSPRRRLQFSTSQGASEVVRRLGRLNGRLYPPPHIAKLPQQQHRRAAPVGVRFGALPNMAAPGPRPRMRGLQLAALARVRERV